jgi:GNAT superfamily N-acetyltransferase
MQVSQAVELGPATLEDLPTLLALLAELFTQEADFAPNSDRQARALRAILTSPERGRILVARCRGCCVGMVSLLETMSTAEGCPAAWLEDMVIAKEWRSKGIGGMLIESAMKDCRDRGITRVTLLTDDNNRGAQRFYTQHGFVRSMMVPYRRYLRD